MMENLPRVVHAGPQGASTERSRRRIERYLPQEHQNRRGRIALAMIPASLDLNRAHTRGSDPYHGEIDRLPSELSKSLFPGNGGSSMQGERHPDPVRSWSREGWVKTPRHFWKPSVIAQEPFFLAARFIPLPRSVVCRKSALSPD